VPEDTAVAPLRERLNRNLWRIALVGVTVVMAAFALYEPVVAVFGMAPMVIWCLGFGRSRQDGLTVGLILAVPTAWILLPRDLGLSGPWVPSVFEVCVFWPVLAALICAIGPRRGIGCLPSLGLSLFVVAGFFTALLVVLDYSEGTTGDEGVWPGPSGLQAVQLEMQIGSGGYTRTMQATGDRATERMRDYLDARGFKPTGKSLCQTNGLLLTYKVCATVTEVSPDTVRVSWRI
jgi:hypothetical protein